MILALGGCSPIDEDAVGAQLGVVETVARVTWGDIDADAIRVEYGRDVDYGFEAEDQGGSALLYGMGPDEEWHYRVVVDAGGHSWASEDHKVHTGAVAAGTPGMERIQEGDPGERWIVSTWLESRDGPSSVYVLDADATVVWSHTPPFGLAAGARLTADRRAIAYIAWSYEHFDQTRIVRVSLEGVIEEELELPYLHHDFIEVPFARYVVLQGEIRDWEGQPVIGDRIVEIGEDGSERVVWNAFDHFEVERNWGFVLTPYPIGADWTHANALRYDSATDSYWTSLYMQQCVIQVARATGEPLLTLCKYGGDYAIDEVFGPQHAPEPIDGGVQFFDNGYAAPDRASRLVHYGLEGDQATRTWSFVHPDAGLTTVLGHVATLPDGRLLSSWGDLGDLMVTDDQQIEWRVHVTDPGAVGMVGGFSQF